MRLNGILLLCLLVARIQVTVQRDGVALEPLRIKTKPKRVVLREPFHGGLVQLFRLTGFDGQSHAVGIGIPVLEYISLTLPRAFGCLKQGTLDAYVFNVVFVVYVVGVGENTSEDIGHKVGVHIALAGILFQSEDTRTPCVLGCKMIIMESGGAAFLRHLLHGSVLRNAFLYIVFGAVGGYGLVNRAGTCLLVEVNTIVFPRGGRQVGYHLRFPYARLLLGDGQEIAAVVQHNLVIDKRVAHGREAEVVVGFRARSVNTECASCTLSRAYGTLIATLCGNRQPTERPILRYAVFLLPLAYP